MQGKEKCRGRNDGFFSGGITDVSLHRNDQMSPWLSSSIAHYQQPCRCQKLINTSLSLSCKHCYVLSDFILQCKSWMAPPSTPVRRGIAVYTHAVSAMWRTAILSLHQVKTTNKENSNNSVIAGLLAEVQSAGSRSQFTMRPDEKPLNHAYCIMFCSN